MNTHTKTLTTLFSSAFLALALTASPSQAQTARYLSQEASSCEIFRGLSRSVPVECATPAEKSHLRTLRSFGPTRGLVIYGEDRRAGDAPTSAVAMVETQSAEERRDLSVAFRARFAFDSYELTPEAIVVVDRIAKVLKHDLMQDKVIEIEGHADATGTGDYNMSLSEKRAYAVKQYLVSRHQIDASRLKFVGKGENEPFDSSDPESGINRRVEFRNITG